MPQVALQSAIRQALSLLDDLLLTRIVRYFDEQEFAVDSFAEDIRWPEVDEWLNLPAEFSRAEKLILLVALATHVQPGFFENVMARALPQGGEFVELGGIKGTHHRGMLPTGETALFLLAGMDPDDRLTAQALLSERSLLTRQGLLRIEPVKEGEPVMSGRLLPDHDWLEKVLFGREVLPTFGGEFPARRIETLMTWDDLVLHPQTMEQISDIRLWMEHHEQMEQDAVLARKVKPGYRVLFYGPAGAKP